MAIINCPVVAGDFTYQKVSKATWAEARNATSADSKD